MTNKQIDNLDYYAALKLLQARNVKNISAIVLNGSAEVKKRARAILREEKQLASRLKNKS